MIENEAVPSAPDPAQLVIFSQRFSNSKQVESAIAGDVPLLVPLDRVKTLCGLKGKREKVGKYFLKLSDFQIRYVQVLLSKLGIFKWAPNFDEQPDSIYNEACWRWCLHVYEHQQRLF
ncbi:hypothetical protein O181_010611 [Austropuccinia psidii MF-1]|uniref:Uncharacterized protein n=1 Tax=Austropuccinia psidii MF-1 TaxID=1389203 RepID=A0A9Q3BRD2_9BASI|nr:hypothetical protein [Austropuccinia psidii MF-1]